MLSVTGTCVPVALLPELQQTLETAFVVVSESCLCPLLSQITDGDVPAIPLHWGLSAAMAVCIKISTV